MKQMLKSADQLTDRLFGAVSKICEIISIVGLIGMMLMLIAQTVLKWFSVSILWSDEFVSVLNIWLVFAAASVVSREKKHVQVDFVTAKLPRVLQILLDMVITALCLFACWHVIRGGFDYIANTRNIRTNIIKLPMTAIYSAPVAGIVFMALMLVKDEIVLICRLFKRKGAAQA